jgi:hypothetical protein
MCLLIKLTGKSDSKPLACRLSRIGECGKLARFLT